MTQILTRAQAPATLRRGPSPAGLQGLIGAGLLLLSWQLLAGTIASGHGTIPTPLAILRQVRTDGVGFYVAGALHTLRPAALGWLWGNALAIGLALLAAARPVLIRPAFRLGVISFCLPIIAIGPVLTILFNGDVPRIALAALSVFFITLVGTLTGLRSVDATMLDMVHGFGGGRAHALLKVRARAALPSLFGALRVAAPSAILGAIVGEFFGAEHGLGVMLINAQQGLAVSRTWAITLTATLLAGLAYALTDAVARLLTPWAREIPVNLAASLDATAGRPGGTLGRRLLRGLGSAVGTVLVVLVVWWGLLRLFGVAPFIGKGPLDVWAYLTDPDNGAANRAAMASEAVVTLRDACLGLVAGACAASSCAVAFIRYPALDRLLLGPALALQSVPLVAAVPLIVLVFGRDLVAITVIGGIVTFFPTLVNVSLALKRTPRQSIDLAHVFGGSRIATLRRVQLPLALPALFASLRIAAPLAMTGAMLAEWLATGDGLGYGILNAAAVSDYDGLWARVVLTTLFSMALYRLVGLTEQAVLARLGAIPDAR